MNRIMITCLLAIACLACSCGDRNATSHRSGAQTTYKFDNYTLTQAIARIRYKRGNYYSFKVRNDRKFEYLVFENVINTVDLLREIKSETHGEIVQAGRSVLIILPKLE